MRLTITTVQCATNAEWDAIWSECEYSTYFHSREWAEIWQAYTDGNTRPDPRLVVFSDGKRALLPISRRTEEEGRVEAYLSSPAGTIGGWLSVDGMTIDHAKVLTRFLTRRFVPLVWRMNPYDALALKAAPRKLREDETRAIRLEDGFDTIYRRWTKGHRSAVRQAQRSGVTTKIATTIDEWHTYYALYEDSLRRWGEEATSRYSWKLFETIEEAAAQLTRDFKGKIE